MTKNKFQQSEEEEKRIIYFRRFQKEGFFVIVCGDDWSTWGDSFRATSSKPGVSFIFTSLKKNIPLKSTTRTSFRKYLMLHVCHTYRLTKEGKTRTARKKSNISYSGSTQREKIK